MIKPAGSNASPAEVELHALEGVHNACVAHLPDRKRGQPLVAAVVARADAALDKGAIACRSRAKELPLLHSAKVAQRQVATLMAEKLSRPA